MSNTFLGENIRKLRDNAGFTQSNIAQFVGVDQSLISKVEKGERTLSADLIEKLAALFAVPVEELENQSIVASKLSFAFTTLQMASRKRSAGNGGISRRFAESIMRDAFRSGRNTTVRPSMVS